MSWHRSWLVLVVTGILLPPLGAVLLWLRTDLGVIRRLAGTVLLALVAVAHLYIFFGLRVEMDGTGRYPIFSFYDPDAHYQALLESRHRQAVEPETAPAVVEAAPAPSGLASPSPLPAPPEAPAEAAGPANSLDLAYWTDFRGPARDGHYREQPVRTLWPAEGLPLLWRQPVGGGYASFVVAGGKAFTIEQRKNREVVAAYDVETGRELWTYGWDGEFRESMGGDGPRATPTWADGLLYALGAEGHLVCLEAETGRRVWSRHILKENGAENLPWGMSASPLVVAEKVVVLPGGRGGNSVVAYHRQTGEKLWQSLSDKQAYTSPMLVELAGRRQILVVSAERVAGLDVEDGSLLWDYPWVTSYGVNAAQPLIVDRERFFISAGYGHGAALVRVEGSAGDYRASTVWQNIHMKNKFNSSVLYQGHIYGLDEGILTCLDVETGERRWKGGRYGYGQLLLADGHLIVLTEGGDLVLVEATPREHREIARFSALRGKTWNHPALAGGRLLVRNTTEMACFDITG